MVFQKQSGYSENDVTIPSTEQGKQLTECLSRLGYPVSLPCGGNGKCGNCKVKLVSGKLYSLYERNIPVIPDEDGMVLACSALIGEENVVVRVKVFETVQEGKSRHDCTSIAVDLGTTTVAMAFLYNTQDDEEITFQNPECEFGADVISRISAAEKNGVEAVRSPLLIRLNRELIGCEEKDITVVGNPTMLSLLAGISPTTIGISPFNSPIKGEFILPGEKIGLHCKNVIFLPGVKQEGFLGSDATCAALAANLPNLEKPAILIDLGTNGEIFFSQGNEVGFKLFAASTAVGPAFEGAEIISGLPGIPGAVCHVEERNGILSFETIDDKRPIGICGSGLIDLVAVLLNKGILSEDGRLDSPYQLSGTWMKENQTVNQENTVTSVVLTQADIRAVQLAKSAVRAAIDTILKTLWIDSDEVEHVFLAGSFGKYLNPKSASRIGLLPPLWDAISIPIGNAALNGCKDCAINPQSRGAVATISQNTEVIDLNNSPHFHGLFLQNMVFPK